MIYHLKNGFWLYHFIQQYRVLIFPLPQGNMISRQYYIFMLFPITCSNIRITSSLAEQ